jgi:RNA polymerase sigma-70 factor (ECF subfamily)
MKRQPRGGEDPESIRSPKRPFVTSSEPIATSDHDLIRQAQRGEELAFGELVRRYEARAWRVARNMIPNDDDARDLVQDAFLRVFRSLDRFDFAHEFGTWLYRIVTNLAIDQLRKRRPQANAGPTDDEGTSQFDLPDPNAHSPSQRVEAAETAVRVRTCLASLAPHFQSVLVLREIEGLGCPEIAGIVGATHVTVRWRLHRGRKLFQEEWERRERLAERGDPTAWTAPREVPADDPNDADLSDVDELDGLTESP